MTQSDQHNPLKRPDLIRQAYSKDETAEAYVEERFQSGWGALLHRAQVAAVNEVIRQHGVKTVLEIAPGPARLSAEISGFDHGVLCEYNQSMITVARDR